MKEKNSREKAPARRQNACWSPVSKVRSERQPPGLPRIFICQFNSPFVHILFAAAVVPWVSGQTINSFFIFVVLLQWSQLLLFALAAGSGG